MNRVIYARLFAACQAVDAYSRGERSDWPIIINDVRSALESAENTSDSQTGVPQVADPSVPVTEVPRLNRSAREVLRFLLSRGSATTAQLLEVSSRFGARLHELRKAGHIITTRNIGEGAHLYTYHRGPSVPSLLEELEEPVE